MKNAFFSTSGRFFSRRSLRFGTSLLLLSLASACQAQQADANLEKKVRSVLETHCYRCHSHETGKNKGGLMVDSRALLLKGGESGPAIVPGHPEKSLLIKAIRHEDENLKMPEKGKLSDADIALLTAWIKAEAPWTEKPVKQGLRTPGKITADDRAYWAFQPLKNTPLPNVDEANPIDRFILARLTQEGLKPSPPAEPHSLIRRITFDLTGLPPTPEETDAFVRKGGGQKAVERLVDRLLASPRHGERWARHWLDLVRFAESDGYRLDSFRPQAWRYRDYVIKAFNDDKPYDQFVREQLAGDELFPDNPDALVAIGFLTHGIYEFNQSDVRSQWSSILSEAVDVTSEVFMGLSMGCARCHDHKFDPILQKDYYALRAFFEGLMPSEELPHVTAAAKAEHDRRLAAWAQKTAKIRAQIEAIEAPERAKVAATSTARFPRDIQDMLRKPADRRTPQEQQLATLAHRQLAFEYEKLDTRIKGEAKERLLQLRKDLAKFDADKPSPLPMCQSLREVGAQPPATLLPRKTNPEKIEPGFLTVMSQPAPTVTAPKHQVSSGRRAALAQWLTRPDHPLTSRVIVNRVWQQRFGRGLVATANDFGNLGDRPSHPELLDWLAQRFMQDGWSMKKLHRLIVTSKTYQQAALPSPLSPEGRGVGVRGEPNVQALKKDPDNRLLWRMTTRRLEAEQIRDAILSINGKLDLLQGGPSVELKEPRRSIYLKATRNTRDPLLEVFDLPDAFVSTAQRNATTTSTQALFMVNSPMMLQQAQALGDVLHRSHKTDDERIELAFRLAFGRSPSSKEKALALSFLEEQSQRIVPTKDKAPADEVAKIPFHEGRAALITPGGPQVRFQLPDSAKLPAQQFTVEAYVYLRSVFEDGTVRTIASHWDGDTKGNGWVLGVTGKKSSYKPQTLVLQLWGQNGKDQQTYEAIFSGLHLQLNRPYYVAMSVNVQDPSDQGITFYLKDLANDEEPLLVYGATHKVVKMPSARGNFAIGGTIGKTERTWDGMIDDVRLSNSALAQKELLLTADAMSKTTVGFWQFEATPGMLQDSSPNRLTLQRFGSASMPAPAAPIDARRAAWIDFCQVLLNANEFLYVD